MFDEGAGDDGGGCTEEGAGSIGGKSWYPVSG